MNHTRLWTAAGIIALVVIVGFVLSVPRAGDVARTSLSQEGAAPVPAVTLRDVFKKGTHTISGSLEAPNACTAATAQASLTTDASGTESILVAIAMPLDTGVCLQVPTRVTFSTTVNAPAGLPLSVTVNGEVATTTES